MVTKGLNCHEGCFRFIKETAARKAERHVGYFRFIKETAARKTERPRGQRDRKLTSGSPRRPSRPLPAKTRADTQSRPKYNQKYLLNGLVCFPRGPMPRPPSWCAKPCRTRRLTPHKTAWKNMGPPWWSRLQVCVEKLERKLERKTWSHVVRENLTASLLTLEWDWTSQLAWLVGVGQPTAACLLVAHCIALRKSTVDLLIFPR